MEDLRPVKKRAVKDTQVLGPGFFGLEGQFKLMTVNFPL